MLACSGAYHGTCNRRQFVHLRCLGGNWGARQGIAAVGRFGAWCCRGCAHAGAQDSCVHLNIHSHIPSRAFNPHLAKKLVSMYLFATEVPVLCGVSASAVHPSGHGHRLECVRASLQSILALDHSDQVHRNQFHPVSSPWTLFSSCTVKVLLKEHNPCTAQAKFMQAGTSLHSINKCVDNARSQLSCVSHATWPPLASSRDLSLSLLTQALHL